MTHCARAAVPALDPLQGRAPGAAARPDPRPARPRRAVCKALCSVAVCERDVDVAVVARYAQRFFAVVLVAGQDVREGLFAEPPALEPRVDHEAAEDSRIGPAFRTPVHEKADQHIVVVDRVRVHFGVVFSLRDGNRVAAYTVPGRAFRRAGPGRQPAHLQYILCVNRFYTDHGGALKLQGFSLQHRKAGERESGAEQQADADVQNRAAVEHDDLEEAAQNGAQRRDRRENADDRDEHSVGQPPVPAGLH